MDPLSKLSRTLATLRRTATTPRQEAGSARPGAAARQAAPPARQASIGELRALIARRLRAIDPSDPAQRDAGARLFLEHALLHELGPELVNSQRFRQMVGDVFDAMNADPALRAELDALIRELAAEA